MFGYEGWEVTSGEEGLSEVGSVDVEAIRVASDPSCLDGQRKENGAFGRCMVVDGEMEVVGLIEQGCENGLI